MSHRVHSFVRAATILLPALATVSCGDMFVVGSVDDPGDEPPPAMTGGTSPPTSHASSGSGGVGGGGHGSGGGGEGEGGGGGKCESGGGGACEWNPSNPILTNANQYQTGEAVAIDGAGNVVVTGRFNGTMELGMSPILATQPTWREHLFVAKLDACGNPRWVRKLDTKDGGGGLGVEVDSCGNIIVAGNSGTLTRDILVAKLNAAGDLLWTRGFAVDGEQSAVDMAIDANDDTLITGYLAGDVTFDNGQTLHGDSGLSAFFAKLNPAGDTVWAKSFAGVSQGRAIAVDSAKNVLLTGIFEGTIDLGGGPIVSNGDRDVFVAKFDPEGNHIWSRGFGTISESKSLDVAVDSADAVIFTGTFHFDLDLGGGPLNGTNHESTFLAKFSSAGDHLWSRGLVSGPEAYTLGDSIAVDVDDSIVVTGFFYKTLPLCGEPLVSAGQGDLFLARYDASGTCLTTRRYGGTNDERVHSLRLTPSGSAVLTGQFLGIGYDFSGMNVTTTSALNLGAQNLFVGFTTP